MKLLLAADILAELLRGNREAHAHLYALPTDAELAASTVTAAELYRQASIGPNAVRRFQDINRLFSGLPLLPVDLAVAARCGGLRAQLDSAGISVGEGELLVAATAMVHGHTLVTHMPGNLDRIHGLFLDDWLDVGA